MSRIGKKPILLPSNTKLEISENLIKVTGPKGTLQREIRPEISVEVEGDVINVLRKKEDRIHRSFHGLTRTLVANMVEGVTTGFTKSLQLVGVGYRAQMQGTKLVIQIGYSHPVEIDTPEGLVISVEGNTKVNVTGIDKQAVGDIAAKIRAVRKPEPYKGKGIRYFDEVVRKKAGKSGK